MQKRLEISEAEMKLRKRVKVKIGDTLLFSPGIEAIAGENGAFFRRYDGMRAKVLGFGEDDISIFAGALSRAADSEVRREPVVGRIYVEFENGDTPPHSLHHSNFVVE